VDAPTLNDDDDALAPIHDTFNGFGRGGRAAPGSCGRSTSPAGLPRLLSSAATISATFGNAWISGSRARSLIAAVAAALAAALGAAGDDGGVGGGDGAPRMGAATAARSSAG